MSFSPVHDSTLSYESDSFPTDWPMMLESIGLFEQQGPATLDSTQREAVGDVVAASIVDNSSSALVHLPSSSVKAAECQASNACDFFQASSSSQLPDGSAAAQATLSQSAARPISGHDPLLPPEPPRTTSLNYVHQQQFLPRTVRPSDLQIASSSGEAVSHDPSTQKGKRSLRDLSEHELDALSYMQPAKRIRKSQPVTVQGPSALPQLPSFPPSHQRQPASLSTFYPMSRAFYDPPPSHSGNPSRSSSGIVHPSMPGHLAPYRYGYNGQGAMRQPSLHRDRFQPHAASQYGYRFPHVTHSLLDGFSQAYPLTRTLQQDNFVAPPLPRQAYPQPATVQTYPGHFGSQVPNQYAVQQAFAQGPSSSATLLPPNPFALRQASWTPDPYSSYGLSKERTVSPWYNHTADVPGQIKLPTVPEMPKIPWSSSSSTSRRMIAPWQPSTSEAEPDVPMISRQSRLKRTTGKKAVNKVGNGLKTATKTRRRTKRVAVAAAALSTADPPSTPAATGTQQMATPRANGGSAEGSLLAGPVESGEILSSSQRLVTCDFTYEDGSICGQTFERVPDKNRHVQSIHKGKRAGPCVCNKMFSRSDAFKRHLKGACSGKKCRPVIEEMALREFGSRSEWWKWANVDYSLPSGASSWSLPEDQVASFR